MSTKTMPATRKAARKQPTTKPDPVQEPSIPPPPRPLGRVLKDARIAQGISLKDAAALCGVHKSNLARIENSSRQTSYESVRKLIEALDLPLEEFFSPSSILVAAARLMSAKAKQKP